jgi:hypothetical protein
MILANMELHVLTAWPTTLANALLDTKDAIAKSTLTSVHHNHARMVPPAMTLSTPTSVSALPDTKETTAKSTLMSACDQDQTSPAPVN